MMEKKLEHLDANYLPPSHFLKLRDCSTIPVDERLLPFRPRLLIMSAFQYTINGEIVKPELVVILQVLIEVCF